MLSVFCCRGTRRKGNTNNKAERFRFFTQMGPGGGQPRQGGREGKVAVGASRGFVWAVAEWEVSWTVGHPVGEGGGDADQGVLARKG